MKIFLSYSAENRPLADRLRGALQSEGHTVFQDREEIKVGVSILGWAVNLSVWGMLYLAVALSAAFIFGRFSSRIRA